jgi:hypothetical protein
MKALAALGLGNEPEPYPEWLQKRFDQGSRGESVVLAKLRDAFDKDMAVNGGAWTTVDEKSGHQYQWHGGQLLVEIPVGERIVIRGHADGLGELYSRPLDSPFQLREKRLIEVKTTSEAYAQATIDSLSQTDFHTTAALKNMYAYQTSSYAWYFGLKILLVMGIKDQNGDVERIRVKGLDKPPVTLGQVKRRVIEIERRIRVGDMGRCDVKNWPCQFSWLCDGVIGGEEGTRDEDLEKALQDSLVMVRQRKGLVESGE